MSLTEAIRIINQQLFRSDRHRHNSHTAMLVYIRIIIYALYCPQGWIMRAYQPQFSYRSFS